MTENNLPYPFLDTNIFLRFLLGDSETQTPACAELFRRVESEGLLVQSSATVIFETVFTLQSFYKVPRVEIRSSLMRLLVLENLAVPHREIYPVVFDLYLSIPSLSFADAYHAGLVRKFGCKQFISFDRGFDKIQGFIRTTPDLV